MRHPGGQQRPGRGIGEALGTQRVHRAQEHLRGGEQALTSGPAGEGEAGARRAHRPEHHGAGRRSRRRTTSGRARAQAGPSAPARRASPSAVRCGSAWHTAACSGDTAAATGAGNCAHFDGTVEPELGQHRRGVQQPVEGGVGVVDVAGNRVLGTVHGATRHRGALQDRHAPAGAAPAGRRPRARWAPTRSPLRRRRPPPAA